MHRFTSALVLTATMALTPPVLAEDIPALDTVEARVAYGIGLRVGTQISAQGIPDFDIDAFVLAIRDQLEGNPPRVEDDDILAAFKVLSDRAEEREQARLAGILADGRAFLEQNGVSEDVVTTESGLQYSVVTEGSGDSPSAADSVTVHYEGRLLSGQVFDSSIARGEPATFLVGQVIPGWQEALQLMKPGAKWEVWIPSEAAYGPRGTGQAIGPNEVLNFTIELISVDG